MQSSRPRSAPTREQILYQRHVYWVIGTAASVARFYYENVHGKANERGHPPDRRGRVR